MIQERNVFKLLNKLSVFIPLIVAYDMYYDPQTLYITELNYMLNAHSTFILFIAMNLIWQTAPARKYFSNGKIHETLYNIFPTEIFLLLYFAERHFWMTIVMCVIFLILLVQAIIDNLKNKRFCSSKKQYKAKKCGTYRLCLSCICVISLGPAFITYVVYGMQGNEYIPSDEYAQTIVGKETDETSDEDDFFVNNKKLLMEFTEENWTKKSVRERVDLVQQFSTFEDERLGIATVPIRSQKLNQLSAVAYYSNENGDITVDTKYLMELSAEEILKVFCEENYHAMEDYIVQNIDWNSELSNTQYFQEAKNWKDNLNHYVLSALESYNAYEEQPLEASAKTYAEQETKLIMEYIKCAESGEQ